MEQKTLVHTHPWLIKFMASKGPLHVLAAIAPLFAGFFLLAASRPAGAPHILLFLAGAFYWTFLEYAIHRWPYHTRFKHPKLRWIIESFHLYHHRNMTDFRILNAGPLMIYPLLIFLTGPLLLLLWPRLDLYGAMGMGLACAYSFYEAVHFGIHYKKHDKGYMAFIQKYHLHHHYKNWNKNFGNTSSFWDRLLGTYDPKYKELVMDDKKEEDTILGKMA